MTTESAWSILLSHYNDYCNALERSNRPFRLLAAMVNLLFSYRLPSDIDSEMNDAIFDAFYAKVDGMPIPVRSMPVIYSVENGAIVVDCLRATLQA